MEQRSTNAEALRARQYIEMINRTFAKCDDANQSLVLEVAPQLTGPEHIFSEKLSIFFVGVKPREVWKGIVERRAMNRSSSIHIVQFKASKHLAAEDLYRRRYGSTYGSLKWVKPGAYRPLPVFRMSTIKSQSLIIVANF